MKKFSRRSFVRNIGLGLGTAAILPTLVSFENYSKNTEEKMWTVIKEDVEGNAEEILEGQFLDSTVGLTFSEKFKVSKYLDPYGDTTFNSLMLKHLVIDLQILKIDRPNDIIQIDEVIKLATSCINEPHTYLNFMEISGILHSWLGI